MEYLIYIIKKETDVLFKMINRQNQAEKTKNLLTFSMSKKHVIFCQKDKIRWNIDKKSDNYENKYVFRRYYTGFSCRKKENHRI